MRVVLPRDVSEMLQAMLSIDSVANLLFQGKAGLLPVSSTASAVSVNLCHDRCLLMSRAGNDGQAYLG